MGNQLLSLTMKRRKMGEKGKKGWALVKSPNLGCRKEKRSWRNPTTEAIGNHEKGGVGRGLTGEKSREGRKSFEKAWKNGGQEKGKEGRRVHSVIKT